MPLHFKWPRKPLLGLVQAMSFANKNPLPPDLELRSGFVATQLGKLSLWADKWEMWIPDIHSNMWYILYFKIVIECSKLPIYFKCNFQSRICTFPSQSLSWGQSLAVELSRWLTDFMNQLSSAVWYSSSDISGCKMCLFPPCCHPQVSRLYFLLSVLLTFCCLCSIKSRLWHETPCGKSSHCISQAQTVISLQNSHQ